MPRKNREWYTVDCLTKQRVPNDGTVPQYYIEDNHESIVSKDIFHLAQKEKARRSNLYSGKRKNKRLYQGKYALSGKVICDCCGEFLDGSSRIVEAVNQWSGDVSPEWTAPLNARLEQ